MRNVRVSKITDIAAMIGKTMLMASTVGLVPVRVLDAKIAYGHTRVLVVAAHDLVSAGTWIDIDKLKEETP